MQKLPGYKCPQATPFHHSANWSICVFAKWQINIGESTIYSYQNAI